MEFVKPLRRRSELFTIKGERRSGEECWKTNRSRAIDEPANRQPRQASAAPKETLKRWASFWGMSTPVRRRHA